MHLHIQHFPSFPQETINTGPFVMRSTCRRCSGRGSIITNPCVVCRGAGQAKQKKRVTIPVPAGGPLPGRWASSVVPCCLHDCGTRLEGLGPQVGGGTRTCYSLHLYQSSLQCARSAPTLGYHSSCSSFLSCLFCLCALRTGLNRRPASSVVTPANPRRLRQEETPSPK